MDRMMESKFVALALSLFLSQSVLAGGVGLSSTRVIYDGSKKEASLTVQNKSKTEEFLIQSGWMMPRAAKKHRLLLHPHYSSLIQKRTIFCVLWILRPACRRIANRSTGLMWKPFHLKVTTAKTKMFCRLPFAPESNFLSPGRFKGWCKNRAKWTAIYA